MSEPVDTGDVDVAALPTTVFGPRDMGWWGAVGFMAIEGTTLVVAASAYLYLWRNTPTWPPEHTLRPSLLWPTITVAVLVLSNIPMHRITRVARALDLPGLRRWMLVASVLSVAFVFLRWQDMLALNTRWDTNAYASSAWFIAGMHASLLVMNACETLVFTAFLHTKRVTERHFSDACDAVAYWYFMTLVWVPLYALVYLGPYLF
jgi:cytochrome c oxidase subunit I+III